LFRGDLNRFTDGAHLDAKIEPQSLVDVDVNVGAGHRPETLFHSGDIVFSGFKQRNRIEAGIIRLHDAFLASAGI
jgi:hypothetical protein